MKSRRRLYLVESDISVISIICRETNRERQTCNQLSTACLSSEMRYLITANQPVRDEMSSDLWVFRDELRSILREFLSWASILREVFPFCILILDFILRIGNFEISSIKGISFVFFLKWHNNEWVGRLLAGSWWQHDTSWSGLTGLWVSVYFIWVSLSKMA